MTRWRKFTETAVKVGSLTWLVVHFTMTMLFVMPANPVKLVVEPVVNATIGTFFGQNWSLFAPNPVDVDQALLVRCLTQREADAIATQQDIPTDDWHDLSTPLWTRFQQNRFSAYDRLVRPQSTAIRRYVNGGPDTWDYKRLCDEGKGEDACETYETMLEQIREGSGGFLAKIGSAFCSEVQVGKEPTSHVALRLRQSAAVPWTKRHTEESEVSDYDIGVYPYDAGVVPLGLYQVTGKRS